MLLPFGRSGEDLCGQLGALFATERLGEQPAGGDRGRVHARAHGLVATDEHDPGTVAAGQVGPQFLSEHTTQVWRHLGDAVENQGRAGVGQRLSSHDSGQVTPDQVTDSVRDETIEPVGDVRLHVTHDY